MIGFWFFASVCACLLFAFAVILLRVRVADTKNAAIAHQIEMDRTGQEAITVLTTKSAVDRAQYEYACRQAEFGQRVLELYSQGQFKIEEPDLVQAIVRQLNGVAPPPHTPKSVISQRPMATWPDGTTYETRQW